MSKTSTLPSPLTSPGKPEGAHVFVVQLVLHVAGQLPRLLPVSHCSPASTTLLPHTAPGFATLKFLVWLFVIAFPVVSVHLTYRVYEFPFVNPVSVLVCVVVPVPLMVFALGMLVYVWFVVLHLHVAGSFVVTVIGVFVVPAISTWLAVGAVIVAVGGVVSGGGGVPVPSTPATGYGPIQSFALLEMRTAIAPK